MNAIVMTLKMSDSGEIKLPPELRDALGTDTLRAVLSDGKVILEPEAGVVDELAGSLSKYAKNVPPGMTWDEIREQAWTEATKHLVGNGARRRRR